MNLRDEFEEYGSEEPLPEYLTLMGLFGALFVLLWTGSQSKAGPSPTPVKDAALFALTTHKLSRLIARDRVTAPLRAPFAKYEKGGGQGELEEESRGTGMRKAIGNLLTCPYCIAPWVALSLKLASHVAPGAFRIVTHVFSAVAASDFLNLRYARLRDEA